MKRQGEMVVESPDISRQSLARLIRSYLAGEISAFRFDESLQAFHASNDDVVREVTRMLWFFYDDITDHNFPLSKPLWDLHQRLLLVLESDCRVETSVESIWSFRQIIAVLALALFAWVVYVLGWGEQIVLVTIPFGLVSMALRNDRSEAEFQYPYGPIVWPFASFADLARAYDSSNFRKNPYPIADGRSIDGGRNLDDQQTMIQILTCYLWEIMYAIYSPLWLLLQVLPETRRSTRFRMD